MTRALVAFFFALGCGSAPPPSTTVTADDPCAATPADCADEASCRAALEHAATERDTLSLQIALGELLAPAGDGTELAALTRAVLAADFACDDSARAAEVTAGWARALHARAQAGEAAAIAPADAVYSAWVTRFPDHPSAASVHFAHGQLLLYRSDTPERALVPLLLAAEGASDPALQASALRDAATAARSASPIDLGAALPRMVDRALALAPSDDSIDIQLGLLVLALEARERALADRLWARLDDDRTPAAVRDLARDMMPR